MSSDTSPTKLRQRLHILQSLSESHRADMASPERSASGTRTDSISGSDSHSGSETEEELDNAPTPKPRVVQQTAVPPVHTQPLSSAWYEINLSIIVALVSPVGNWLTGGGDYVKNWLVLLILVFYLHQVVEIPWSLYQSTLPRHAVDIHLESSQSLARLNKIYLFLSVSSPILGALLLHVVLGNGITTFLGLGAAADSSEGVLSWFSTTLFVLATSIRPGSELVRRLQGQITHLHSSVHEHHASLTAHDQREQERVLAERLAAHSAELIARIAVLEKANRKYTQKIDEVHDYVDELEHALEKTEKETKKSVLGLAERVDVLEHSTTVTKLPTSSKTRRNSTWKEWQWVWYNENEKVPNADTETWLATFWRWFLTPHTPEWMIVGQRPRTRHEHDKLAAKARSPTNIRLETIHEGSVLLSPSNSCLNLASPLKMAAATPSNSKTKRVGHGMSVKIPPALMNHGADAFTRSPRSSSSSSSSTSNSDFKTPPSPLPLPSPTSPSSKPSFPFSYNHSPATANKRPWLLTRVFSLALGMMWTIFFITFWPVVWPIRRVRSYYGLR